MKGDFSTERFNPSKHFNRVLKQQGRVDLDSDWNEQAAIAQHHLRSLIVDLLGRAGGPTAHCGFGLADAPVDGVTPAAGDFIVGAGRYYVDGLMVENERASLYSAQPALPAPGKLGAGKSYIAYLDVWERHITYIEDDSIREVALGGPDTATRVQTLWQVKVMESNPPSAAPPAPPNADKVRAQLADAQAKLAEAKRLKKNTVRLEKQVSDLQAKLTAAGAPVEVAGVPVINRGPVRTPPAGPVDCGNLVQTLDWTSGTMTARLPPADPSDTPCVLPPESRYRGLENHLYRIEIHASGDTADTTQVPTFKWSRDNGSVVTRWLGTTGEDVRISSTRDFAARQWVEFTTESDDLLGQPGPLTCVTKVDGDLLTVENAPALPKDAILPKVRRWDQTANDELTLVDGAIAIVPAPAWIKIEDGIEVQFSPGQYRSGDYWLITARVVTGAIDWPMDSSGTSMALPPHGIVHHYAPLFIFDAIGSDPFVKLSKDCRCAFAPLQCLPPPKPNQ